MPDSAAESQKRNLSKIRPHSLIKWSTGRKPSASIAREISVCIQQGRLYFEAANAAPIQIKPLLIYYGVVGFAQAVIVAVSNSSLATLARAHGLTNISPLKGGVESLTLRFEKSGTFQEFNNAIAPLGRIAYYDNYMPKWYQKPFDSASGLTGKDISIREILARIPRLAGRFKQTFGSPAKMTGIMWHFGTPNTGRCELRIDDPELYTDRTSLAAAVQRWRADYPFLDRWRFVEATHAWGNAILTFDNAPASDEDDTAVANLVQASNNGFVNARFMMGASNVFVSAEDILPPLSGGYVRSADTYVLQPVAGVRLSEYSLQFLGCFLLSSLVRYRPQIWQNAISRSATQDKSADDRSLSLIEQFLDEVLNGFPNMVVHVIDYKRAQ
jgi:YaaC-like Protein